MWQRWNQTTHIFEKSDTDGASWVPLPLSGSVITEGTVADARLSSNIPLKNAANVFTEDQTIDRAGPVFKGKITGGTRPIRFAQWGDGAAWLTQNIFWNGTGWSLDNTGFPGDIIQLDGTNGIGLYHATAGANPRAVTEKFRGGVDGAVYEDGRANGMGRWVTFTPTLTADAGTWTLGTSECAYMLIGRTCFIRIRLENTNLSTTPAVLTLGNLPQPAAVTITDNWNIFNGAAWLLDQFVQLLGGTSTLTIQKGAGGFYTTGAGTYIRQYFWYEF